jgi:hypothetical protein
MSRRRMQGRGGNYGNGYAIDPLLPHDNGGGLDEVRRRGHGAQFIASGEDEHGRPSPEVHADRGGRAHRWRGGGLGAFVMARRAP